MKARSLFQISAWLSCSLLLATQPSQAQLNIGSAARTIVSTNTIDSTYIKNGSISGTDLKDGTIYNADVNTSAAIAGTKVSPNFGSQTLTLGGNTVYDLTTTDTTSFRPVTADINYVISPIASAAKAIDYHGIDLISYSNATTTNASTGIYPFETNAQYGGTGTVGRLVGGYFFANNTSSGTVTDVWPIRVLARNTGSGTVTNLRGINIESGVNSGGGIVTNNIGLYIGSQMAGSSNFSIYSAGGNMYHAGKIGINTQPSYSLHVVGSATKDYTAFFSDVCTDASYSLPAMSRFQAWFQPTSVSGAIDYFGQNNIVYSDKTLQSGCRLFGIYQNAQYSGTATINELVPFYAFTNNTSTGTVSYLSGVRTLLRNTSTGTVTEAQGVRISSTVNSGGGTITTNTGLYIEAQTAGTTDYSIYSAGGNMYHAGSVAIGAVPEDAIKLNVHGSVKLWTAIIDSVTYVGTDSVKFHFSTGKKSTMKLY